MYTLPFTYCSHLSLSHLPHAFPLALRFDVSIWKRKSGRRAASFSSAKLAPGVALGLQLRRK